MTTGVSTSPSSARPRRSRLRTWLPLGLAVWVVLEIWLLTMVAGATNGLTVFLLLVAGFVLGSVIVKRAGRRAFRKLNETLQRGGSPSEGSSGNGFLMLGGLLLMIPGLISDAVGLVLVLPPVQKALGKRAERSLDRRLRATSDGGLGDAFQQARIHHPDGKIVQGEVIRRDEPGDSPSDPTEPRPPLTG
ncbi:FxsA family protein [Streptomyces sp. XM83C]|uniref:FxsA family membrane protein n=1 Tax=Streptomyces sp. XM83C TaxID=2929781 RepID=UPI001FF99955|nr:FxsA family membrane protein [Streptomyces sp. XM83C]MCK1818180.1 FxsA family protein [Streptomyces sp. XM83C]